jgi:hypothetical protein
MEVTFQEIKVETIIREGMNIQVHHLIGVLLLQVLEDQNTILNHQSQSDMAATQHTIALMTTKVIVAQLQVELNMLTILRKISITMMTEREQAEINHQIKFSQSLLQHLNQMWHLVDRPQKRRKSLQ